MRLTARLRLLAAAALATAGLGLLTVELSAAGGGSPCAAEDVLCPDLETVSLGSDNWLHLERRKHRLLLRLSNLIGNRGSGPLDMRKTETTPEECIDEAPDPNPDLSRGVAQRIYGDDPADTGSAGYFDRADDAEFTDYTIGCYFFHAKHSHWHFQDFAEYRLERLHTGKAVGQSIKVGFCVLDQSTPFEPDPQGTPSLSHYPTGGGCNDPDDPVGSQGLSIGYADLYAYFTPGQAIDITGIRRGKYCLISTANPLARIYESDPSDASNARRTRIQIKPRENLVRPRGHPC